MDNWNLANLSEEQMLEIKELEAKLGLSLIAYKERFQGDSENEEQQQYDN